MNDTLVPSLASLRLVGLVWAMLIATSGFAWAGEAGDKATAQSLFQAGKALMDAGDLDAACPKLAASVQAYPTAGAVLNLARCYELQGKTATAWSEYSQAEAMAARAGDSDRAELARKLAKELKPKLSTLTVAVTARPAGLEVRRNDAMLAAGAYNVAVAVDPGEHRIEASAPRHQSWSATVTVGPEADQQTITVPMLVKLPEEPKPEPMGSARGPAADPVAPERRADPMGYYVGGGIAAAVGLAGLVVGTVFGLQAQSDWDEAQLHCPQATLCYAEGVELGRDADAAATASNVGFIVGGAGAVVAVVLFVLAPTGEAEPEPGVSLGPLRLVPLGSEHTGGALLRGTF